MNAYYYLSLLKYTMANSDADAYTHVAIDEVYLAVQELGQA
jgi:hypothetical protein